MATDVTDGIGAVDEETWARLAADAEPDAAHGYLLFRERLEPGTALLVTADDDRGPVAAIHAVTAVTGTGLFSHPWKLLTEEQFLRLTPDDDAPRIRAEHRALLGALGPDAPESGDLAGWLTTAVGEPLVVRTYDRSPLFTAPDVDITRRRQAGREVVATLQDLVRQGRAGAVVLPYVATDDELLRDLLEAAGFVRGSVTAASALHLGGYPTYQAFLDGQNAETRRNYRMAEREVTRAGLHVREVPLAEHVDRIVDLEARTGERNGAAPNRPQLRAARAYLAAVLPGAIRVAVAGRSDAEVLACTVQMYGRHGCCTLGYGSDYDVTGTSVAYHHLVFGQPVESCIRAGVPRYRLGFEAFAPKFRRGARVAKRELWLWTPDERQRESFARLLRFLDERTTGHLAAYVR
ncbi:hypothetical protein ACQPYV_05340 [Micromonospora saelicesensis]|uniref:hypothetical protein n=1 Tax=Micromonospora saelicesensis TaxID=285676 RepID=UPI003D8AB1EF